MQIEKSLFAGREREVFQIQDIGDSSFSLTLSKVLSPEERVLQRAQEQGIREPFTLLFSGPLKPFLEQHMYTLHHDELGSLDIFLVPVSQDENSYYYEAVFG